VRTDEKPRSILKQNSPGKYGPEECPGSEYTLVVSETPKAGLKVDNAFLVTVNKESPEEKPIEVEAAEEVGDQSVEKESQFEKPVSVENAEEVGDLSVENTEEVMAEGS
jgi:hypothetical protein